MAIPASRYLWAQRKRNVREGLARGVRHRIKALIRKVDAQIVREQDEDREYRERLAAREFRLAPEEEDVGR
jgi:hypothetical protein